MNKQTYSKGYKDNREFLVGFDWNTKFGLIKHLYYEFPVPMRENTHVIGNFVFSRVDFNSIYHYLRVNNMLRDKMHDLLVDGERLFEDTRPELVIPDFNINTREDTRLSIETSEDPLDFDPEAGIVGIVGVTLKDVPIGNIEIHRPYTFTAKNVLFMSKFIDGSPSFGVF